MAIKIDKKIVNYQVIRDQHPAEDKRGPEEAPRATAEIIQMHERIERPEMLFGSTYPD